MDTQAEKRMDTQTFENAVNAWLDRCREMLTKYYKDNFPNLSVPQLSIMQGSKYWRIVKTDGSSSRSVFAFLDSTNGDVLKPASWKAPAKHSRGNLMDPDGGMGRMGAYGPAYM